jgi:hypothetical protein
LIAADVIATDAGDERAAISLFRYWITYLTLLVAAVAADALHRFPLAWRRAIYRSVAHRTGALRATATDPSG